MAFMLATKVGKEVISRKLSKTEGVSSDPSAPKPPERKGVRHPLRKVAAGMGAVVLLGLIGRCESVFGIEEHVNVRAAELAKLKLAQTIPEETVVARAVANYAGITAADHIDLCADPSKIPVIGGLLPGKMCTPHIASWSVSYSGDIGAKIMTVKSVEAAEKYDPNAKRRDGKSGGALVVNISQNDFALDVYEMAPGEGFITHNSPGGALASNLMNDLKVIPGVDAPAIDHKYDGLRHLVINEAFREMAAPQGCGHLAIDELIHPTNVDADSRLVQPKTIQGNVIKNLVAADNAALQLAKSDIRVTSYDFDVNILPDGGPVALPTEYTQFANGVKAHKPSNLTEPKESSIHQCQPASGMGGGQ